MSLKDIVEVNITRETTSVATAAFNVPLLLAAFATSKTTPTFGRARTYDSLKAMSDEGWQSTDSIYKMASAIFAQNPCVSKVVVGRVDSTYTDIAAELAAIQGEDDSWYGLVVEQALIEATGETKGGAAIASWVESNKKFTIMWSDAEGVIDPEEDEDLASVLKSKAYDRSAVIYHVAPSTGDDYPDAAWMGEGFPYDPGTSTWNFKTLRGVSVDGITASKETVLKAKNCNWYSTVGGVNITQQGKVASGEWIDIIIGTDWIEARLRETIYGALVNQRKLPYDDSGIAAVESLVRGVLMDAAGKGILQADSIEVSVPKYKDIPQADRIARHLPDVKFTALYLGAIHSVKIQGTISV